MLGFTSMLRAEIPTHEQFLRACDLKVGEACWAAAYSYEIGEDLHGNDIGEHPEKSARLYKSA